jgi:CBS-domain-containing membrane protein
MCKKVITAKEDLPIQQAVQLLNDRHVGSVVVIDDEEKCIGIFTERDAVRIMANRFSADEPLSKIMSSHVVTVSIDASFDEAKRLMDEQIALYPQIQEFQALGLAYILLRAGDREGALLTYRDNVELLETRFRDDYTDPDPLLAETLFMFGALAEASGPLRLGSGILETTLTATDPMPPPLR